MSAVILIAVVAVVVVIVIVVLVVEVEVVLTLVILLPVEVVGVVLVVDAVATVMVKALECALSVSYIVDTVLSDVAVESLMGALANVLTVIIIGVPPDIDDDMLADVNVNAFTGVITVGFVMPAPLEGFSC